MKKQILFSFLAMFNFLGNAHSNEIDCSIEGTNNFVLVHGIGGSPESFGEMKNTIPQDIQCSKVYSFEYATKDSQLETVDFSKDLELFISKIPKTKESDVNIISHSQGGLVSLLWITNSLQEKDGYSLETVNRLNTYTTLSTPYWGSDFALMGDYTFFSLGFENNVISPFGKAQLIAMKYGSPYVQEILNTLVSPKNEYIRSFLKNKIRTLNIQAMIPKFSFYTNFVGAQFFEGDGIVNTPSMSLNFNYAEALTLDYSSSATEVLKIKEFRFSKQSHTSGSHLPMIPGVEAVAEVPDDCLIEERCDHQAYNDFKRFYRSEALQANEDIEQDLQGFELHVMVKLPNNHELDTSKDMKIKINPSDDISMSYYRFDHDDQEPLSMIDGNPYFLLKGSIMNPQLKRVALNFTIDILNTKARNITVNVEKGLSTILKTNLVELDSATKIKLKELREAKRKKEKRRRIKRFRNGY